MTPPRPPPPKGPRGRPAAPGGSRGFVPAVAHPSPSPRLSPRSGSLGTLFPCHTHPHPPGRGTVTPPSPPHPPREDTASPSPALGTRVGCGSPLRSGPSRVLLMMKGGGGGRGGGGETPPKPPHVPSLLTYAWGGPKLLPVGRGSPPPAPHHGVGGTHEEKQLPRRQKKQGGRGCHHAARLGGLVPPRTLRSGVGGSGYRLPPKLMKGWGTGRGRAGPPLTVGREGAAG